MGHVTALSQQLSPCGAHFGSENKSKNLLPRVTGVTETSLVFI